MDLEGALDAISAEATGDEPQSVSEPRAENGDSGKDLSGGGGIQIAKTRHDEIVSFEAPNRPQVTGGGVGSPARPPVPPSGPMFSSRFRPAPSATAEALDGPIDGYLRRMGLRSGHNQPGLPSASAGGRLRSVGGSTTDLPGSAAGNDSVDSSRCPSPSGRSSNRLMMSQRRHLPGGSEDEDEDYDERESAAGGSCADLRALVSQQPSSTSTVGLQHVLNGDLEAGLLSRT